VVARQDHPASVPESIGRRGGRRRRHHGGAAALARGVRSGQAYKVGVLQPLSGVAAAGGKTALVGTQVATERINKSGGSTAARSSW